MVPVKFDKDGLPIPQKVSFDKEGLPVPVKKKEVSEPISKVGGKAGISEVPSGFEGLKPAKVQPVEVKGVGEDVGLGRPKKEIAVSTAVKPVVGLDLAKEKAIEKELKALNRKSKKSKDFIQKSTKIHNSKYNYDLVLYENCRTKVKIICPVHGEFEQTPDAHLYSCRGCEKCAREARRKQNGE